MRIFTLVAFLLFVFSGESQTLEFIMDGVHNNPGEIPYVTKYNDPTYLKLQGFNGVTPSLHLSGAITYDNFKNNLIPQKSKERAWIIKQSLLVDSTISAFKNSGIGIYPFEDFLVFPRIIWEKYGDSLRALNSVSQKENHKPDIKRNFTQQLLKAQIEGIFSRFPGIEGIVLRFGETYLHDMPFHFGSSPVNSIEDHIIFINILREEICVKRNKKLFYRTWDFGYNFHNNPDYYLKVTNAILPHPNLIFSIKYQQNDFLRMSPFNPCLGIGKHRQIVEAQSRMEAYGKGAHPYYSAYGVINGWPETKFKINFNDNSFTGELNDIKNPRGIKDILDSGLLCGVNTWSHGGGWQGPYITNEIWTDLNTYVVSHWAQNTSLKEEEIFTEFAKQKGFSGMNLDLFRQICMLTIEGVRKGQCNSFTKNQLWWSRDEFFSVSDNQDVIKSISSKNIADKVLAEKEESVAIWNQIEALSKELDIKDTDLQKAIQVSCTYGRIKYALINEMWKLMLLKYQIQEGESLKEFAKKIIQEYDALWAEWKALKQLNPSCATLYTEMSFRNQQKGSIGELVNSLR